jgi:hypothetical protein
MEAEKFTKEKIIENDVELDKIICVYHTEYRLHGQLHRISGPAVINHDGEDNRVFWFFKGKSIDCLNQQEFEKYLNLKAFW